VNFWKRSATLQIGTRRYEINSLEFKFKVEFSDDEQLSTAMIEVHNLSPQTRNEIRNGDTVIINAGYQNDIGAIFVGQIFDFSHEKSDVDWDTKIAATAALDAWLNQSVNKTYTKDIRASAILNDLLNLFGIEIGQFALVDNISYPRGKVCQGKLKDILREIIVSDCKSRFMIKHDQIVINDPQNGDNRGVVLTAANGLLQSRGGGASLQPTKPNTTTQPRGNMDDKVVIERACLLNYNIGAGDIITVRDSALNGRFLVRKGTFEGSRTGSWKTTMEITPL